MSRQATRYRSDILLPLTTNPARLVVRGIRATRLRSGTELLTGRTDLAA
jgi:hypothetical protein